MSVEGRKPTLQAVGWLRDMYNAKLLDLDPPYQRRSVWNNAYKQFFIDTVLKNYPVPPIFVNMEVTGTGATIYHVIDGKQRLSAILEFLEDGFPISKESYSPQNLAGKYFSALELTTQKSIYGYFLPFEFFTDANLEEVTEIFDRFNRNVARLTEQELRNARYSGEFISLMEQLADEPFWKAKKIFSLADIRRMRDVEFVSVLFVLEMHGILDGDDLDSYYADYDEGVPDKTEHLTKFRGVLTAVERLGPLLPGTRFRNKADFYSLFSAVLDFAEDLEVIDYERTTAALLQLASDVDDVPKLDPGRRARRCPYLFAGSESWNHKARKQTKAQGNAT